MPGRMPEESMLVSKKLLALATNNLRTTGAILVSVIKRPKNKNFLRALLNSTEFSSESFKNSYLGVSLGTKKRFLRNFPIKMGITVKSSTTVY